MSGLCSHYLSSGKPKLPYSKNPTPLYWDATYIVLAQSIHFENLNTIIYIKIQKKSMIAARYGSNYYTRGSSILSQIFFKS